MKLMQNLPLRRLRKKSRPYLKGVSQLGLVLAVAGLTTLTLLGHAQMAPPAPPASPASLAPQNARYGLPLVGLSDAQLDDFADGFEEFTNEETPEGGLGPIFNNVSCVSCHSAPAVGGVSAVTVMRFGRMVNGVFDPMEAQGGSLLQERAIDPSVQEVIPREATVIAKRLTTPVFGLGLIEAIPDDTLLALARAPKPDGVSGRAAQITDVVSSRIRVGRFGWKAQQATLLAFSADAYVNEMGITNRFFPHENAPNGDRSKLARFDRFADPEDVVDPATGKADIDHAADFMRLLAAPPRLPMNASARQGENVFAQLGCATCHTPILSTGRSPIAALDRKPVNLYSDLLLHNMGGTADGIAQADAGIREMRTAPLWGLAGRHLYWHDGRAQNLDTAIRLHEGEAMRSRLRYEALNVNARRTLLDFLNTL
ncbi:MAG: hypothetical protein RLZZ502_817 [Pseudomonadota bacterium]